jgi:hypothetical protein
VLASAPCNMWCDMDEKDPPTKIEFATAVLPGSSGLHAGPAQINLAAAVLPGRSDLHAGTAQLDQHGRKLDLGEREGRPPVPPILIATLRDELRSHLEAERSRGRRPKQDPECIALVAAWSAARGWRIGRATILRKIVRPVHREIWPV